jgi:N-acyl-D-amino-acid deacylase
LDLVFVDVRICDGTGAPVRRGHVGVIGEKIADVWDAAAPIPPARRVIRADSHVLAPGFIDVHSHSDYTVVAHPTSESKLAQGVTTEVVGNCGFSAFPLRGALAQDERVAQQHLQLAWNWQSAEEYFEALEQTRPAVNVASFVGHRNLRAAVMGFDDRRPTHSELRAMENEVERALDAGAMGLSTGLIYVPGMFATTDEIVHLAQVAARRQALYASHVRGEGDRLLSAAQEFFEIVDQADIAAQYSHLKASGRRNWGKVTFVIEGIEKRVAQSRRLAFDRYPYTASSTELSSLLPRWVVAGGREAALERLRDVEARRRVKDELEEDFAGVPPWTDILIAKCYDSKFTNYVGRTLAAIAEELAADPFDLFFELLCANNLEVWICHFTMSEKDMVTVLTHPLCMVCTDAESCSACGAGVNAPHPRGFGSFARFLQYFVREHQLLSLEEAVRKMTSLPAQMFGLANRGVLTPGMAADLVLFNPVTVQDKAEFGQPPRYPAGIKMVVVNGAIAYEDGQFTSKRAGQVLRRKNH